MTSRRSSSHADKAPPPAARPPAPAAPKLQVQRSLSRETVTIHFSALGKEEEAEEEELYGAAVSSFAPPPPVKEEPCVVTAQEASEDMFEGTGLESPVDVAIMPVSSSTVSPIPGPQASTSASPSFSTLPKDQKSTAPSISSSSTPTTSPSRSATVPFSEKPFNLVKSLYSDIEPSSSGASSSSVRHRQLMKTLVKSLSSDTNQDSSGASSSSTPYWLSDSRLNLQLFKQFTQSRAPAASVAGTGDSKTAPSSPLTSPDTRSFFKVLEVEARIEDTKRRLSEAIYEPMQLLNRIRGEDSGSSVYRPKVLSTSTSELSNLASLNNGLLESNNNSYCIKEEEGGEWDTESPTNGASGQADSASLPDAKNPKPASGSMSLALDKCSMSALARQEDEDYCILYSDDFEMCNDTEGVDALDRTDDTATGSRAKEPASGSTEPCSEDDWDEEESDANIPYYTLIFLTAMVYGFLVLPLPTYVGGMLLGVGLGFFLAIGVVWLAGPKPSGRGFRHPRHQGELWKTAQPDVREPSLFKGWMNEIVNYDPETYHATLTHSVFVRLEGSILRLSKPNRNIPRRATHNEPKPDVTYISQKIYDLTDSKIYLAPHSLARKRVWNKKYPVCIQLAKQDDFMSKAESDAADDRAATVISADRAEGAGDASRRPSATQEGGRGPSSRDLTLYLFGRTGREKEEWFQRMLLASKPKTDMKKAASVVGSKSALASHSRSSSRGSLDEALASLPRTRESASAAAGSAKLKTLLDYSNYMASLVPSQAGSSTDNTAAAASAAASPLTQSPQSSPGAGKKLPSIPVAVTAAKEEEPVAWVNAAVGRVIWDFLCEPYWADVVSKKIQMKLSKIRLPYFMNELTLTELDMGVATPKILGASKPSVDHQGLWFDLEISYSGSFLMTLETKMNLIRLGKEGEGLRVGELGKDGYRPRTYCLADSDEESSSAGSSDEEDGSEVTSDALGAEGYLGGHKPSKIMRFVDKIAKSKYFQKATETEFIKKKMEEVSNTPLLLTVEVQELRGTLAVNIPPPPTDRIWYGFRSPPHLELKARPKLGERVVTLAHVTDWIEKKLDQEFQKIFVMPNMDDVWLTIMHSAMDARSASGPLAPDPEPSEPAGGATGDP
ncbi:testis-expressed protein 2-like isoform X1 [Osmerus mordax]|uniref:testis-expressed protein 2-like isoform X1 n=1 Tax=Osmerus mordax TaxID=8014 RepID=UPI00350EF7F8